MRYDPIDPQLFISNRKRFIEHLPAGALAVFNANDIMPTNADGTLPLVQNRDLFYLSGVDQEETILVLFPDAYNPAHREILFVVETNEHLARWEGAKLSQDQATKQTGIQTVFWLSDFEKVFKDLMSQAKTVFLNSNEHLRASSPVETRDQRFRKWIMEQYPMHHYDRSAPIMHRLRAIKSPIEVEIMRKASAINTKAFNRVLKFLKPGVMEYELEAEFIHEYKRNGSPDFSYTPIIASGASACVLHYIENDKECKDGDLVLFDCGNWYANYASDVTRCFPVNGRFSDRQKQVYNAVLRVMKASMELLCPGNQLHEYHKEVGELMTKELLDLKLIDAIDVKNQDPNWPAYKKYFMHGTSHYIGLDVHDVGLWTEKMEAGNVFTCEPGIYIPEEGIGIRIEDDIVIGEKENINLTAGIPKEVEEIEEMMNS
ncbi:aminopeptidase P N-terminal domain-containing protein [Croceimicrobium sp.]|uniref:aminopeptidase P N-terminal domain-containing protein n=1 Tax=Croceimicrobium sp. TaxID=2828340 RepID=UPI003BA88E3A